MRNPRIDTKTMKRALLAASLVLVAGGTAGCGGEGGGGGEEAPPESASKEEFCQNFTDFNAALVKLGADAKDADFIKALKDAGGTFEDTGTPEEASEAERAGFEVFVQLIEDVDENATQEDLSQLEKDLSKEDQQDLEAFTTYVGETCAPA